MMNERVVRGLQVSLLFLGTSWRLFLVMPVRHWDSTIVSLLVGLTPYCLLALLALRIGSRSILLAAGTIVLGIDLASGVAAMTTRSSTGAVAVLLAPIVSSLVLVPVGLLAWSARRQPEGE